MRKIFIIGGGAAGMACAVRLARAGESVTVAERGPRLGRKLSATGNGQGNVTNLHQGISHYVTDDPAKAARILERYPAEETVSFLQSMGGIFLPDGRGRVYPAGRQASAVTDLFRRELCGHGVAVFLEKRVERLVWTGNRFSVDGTEADAVVLAAGGKAAPEFGTDGTAYPLAQAFGHTVTPLSPALVPLRCEGPIRGLKGIRTDAELTVLRAGKSVFCGRGDVLFTDTGVSGDAVFRASSVAQEGDLLSIDLLPDVSEERLGAVCGNAREDELLCVVPNGLGRVLARLAAGDPAALCRLIKRFPLKVTGTLGFSRAQVTRGGIPLAETDECLQSNFRRGLFFAGEILNVDGECGGYNLQWAFASAAAAAEGVLSC